MPRFSNVPFINIFYKQVVHLQCKLKRTLLKMMTHMGLVCIPGMHTNAIFGTANRANRKKTFYY